MEYEWQKKFLVPSIYCIYWLSLKTIQFYGVDTTSFLKNFVVQMYFFIFGDFEVILLKNKNPIFVMKNNLKLGKFSWKSSLLNAFDAFLAQFFS